MFNNIKIQIEVNIGTSKCDEFIESVVNIEETKIAQKFYSLSTTNALLVDVTLVELIYLLQKYELSYFKLQQDNTSPTIEIERETLSQINNYSTTKSYIKENLINPIKLLQETTLSDDQLMDYFLQIFDLTISKIQSNTSFENESEYSKYTDIEQSLLQAIKKDLENKTDEETE